MSDVTLELSNPIELFGEIISEIDIKEPRAHDYLQLGEPRIFARTPDGSFYAIEDIGVVKQYLSRCISKTDSAGKDIPSQGLIAMMALSDIRRAREAVLGFFSDVAPAT
jgi:hypothetical protein